MTDIESPLGKQSFPGNPQQGRVLTVDDPTSGGPSPVHNLNIRPEHFMQSMQAAPPQQQQQQQQYQQPNRQPLRELSQEELRGYEQSKAEAMRQQDAVSRTARERIAYLTGIGRIKTDFEMDGVSFHLQSLKSGELETVLDTMIALGDTNDAKFTFELRRQTLARSLVSVDTMTIQELIGSNDIGHKLELIRSLDENLVDYMYKHYEEKILKVSKDKYGINTQKDVEEVVDTIKK